MPPARRASLHGTVSHRAIREHLYRASRTIPQATVIAIHVHSFLVGFPAMVARL
jgi:hypothetical protein